MDVPTDVWPYSTCDGTGGYLCNNGYDSAGKILSHLLTNIEGGIEKLAPKDYDFKTKGVLKTFKQAEFTDNFESSGLMDEGYIFYPNQCLQESCHIHFLLHGCGGQGDWIINAS